MAKSRVEKNKSLYEEIELNSFEIEDISDDVKDEPVKEAIKEPVVEQPKKQEIVPVAKREKKNEVAVVEKKKKKVKVEEDFVVEQPISYTDKLSVEEILRAKLEKQQKLKDDKKGYKKSPFSDNYTPEMMQKNISQDKGIDIRKEANIRIRDNRTFMTVFLILLLIGVLLTTGMIIYFIW